MTDEEKRIMKKQKAAMRRRCKNVPVPQSPCISIRAIDIGIHFLEEDKYTINSSFT